MRAQDLFAPTRGVRRMRRPDEDETDAPLPDAERLRRLDRRLVEEIKDLLPAFTPHQFASHDSGLALLGTPLPFTAGPRRDVHVSVRRPHPRPERKGVIGHRLQEREPARWLAQGVPVEHPARMWRQTAALWDLDELIAAGDYLIHPRNRLITIEDLRQEVREAGDVRGLLTAALAEIRIGAESPEETRLRLTLTRAGLPEPVLNHNLNDERGIFVARLDLAYPKYRVAAEYDGRGHATGSQFASDADRWDAIRAQGWQHVRVLSHHVRPDPQVAVDKVSRALFDAGWRPGRD